LGFESKECLAVCSCLELCYFLPSQFKLVLQPSVRFGSFSGSRGRFRLKFGLASGGRFDLRGCFDFGGGLCGKNRGVELCLLLRVYLSSQGTQKKARVHRTGDVYRLEASRAYHAVSSSQSDVANT
jgi:hypothetical protein